jgi:hypothetical protein
VLHTVARAQGEAILRAAGQASRAVDYILASGRGHGEAAGGDHGLVAGTAPAWEARRHRDGP